MSSPRRRERRPPKQQHSAKNDNSRRDDRAEEVKGGHPWKAVDELFRLLRWLVVCSLLGFLGHRSLETIEAIMTAEQPLWQAVIVSALGPGGILTVMGVYYRDKLRGYIKQLAAPRIEEEKTVDARRETSGLNPDGTHTDD